MDLDHDAGFDALYAEVGPRLWRAILAYSGGRRDIADEVVAEAFARTLESGARVRDPKSYVFRIAFRLAANELRRQRPTAFVPETSVEQDRGLVELLDALKKLSPTQRAAIYLRYEVGLSVGEVAELLGRSSGAVRVQLHRARGKLAAELGGDDD